MSTLLAATAQGVVRAVPGADGSWSVERRLEDEDVRCLAADGAEVYAGTQGSGIFRSTDGGRTWEPAGLAGTPVKSLALGDRALYAGTREPRVHVSRDGGRAWKALARFPRLRSWWWVQPAERPFRPSYVSALAVSGGAIVAGIELCGVFRSTDGGRSWSGHRRRALRDCHQLETAGDRLYEAGSGGLATSADHGRTWQRRTQGLDRRYGWSFAADGDTLYLVAAPYRSAHTDDARACVYRARGDAPWEPCTDELTTLPRLAAGGGEAFAALGDGGLLRSRDGGGSWERLPVDLGGASRALLLSGSGLA